MFQCAQPGCNFKTSHSKSFDGHLLIHEKDPERQYPFAYKYSGCDFRRRYKCEMAEHERHHKTSKLRLSCKLCPDRHYPDTKSFHFHQCLADNKNSYKCSLCNYAVCDKYTLRKHVRQRHEAYSPTVFVLRRKRIKAGTALDEKNVRVRRKAQSNSYMEQRSRHNCGTDKDYSQLKSSVFDKTLIILLKRIRVESL